MTNIAIHPKFVEKAGAGDIVRHFQLRGYDIGNPSGSKFLHVMEPPGVRPPPTPQTVRLERPSMFNFWPRS